MIKKNLSLFILFFTIGCLYTQTPFIRNFLPEEYKAPSQNWSIVQDHRGIMYFANNHGVLEYDGINWRAIATPIRVRSLGIDSAGTIYVGLESDFGYLKSDSSGRLHYNSLKDKIPQEYQDVKQIWSIYTLEDKIIFVATNALYILQNDHIEILVDDSGFRNDFVVQNRLYVEKKGGGLYLLENGNLRLMLGKENLNTKHILMMLPYQNNDILIATLSQGIYMYNPDKSPSNWKPKGFEAVDDFIIKNQVFSGTLLQNGHFAIGSRKDGILVFDKKGKIHSHYNKQNGLQSNTAYYLFTDVNGQLWAALQNGISLIMTNLPFLCYTDKNGLDGSVYCLAKHNNNLYVGTSNNLYLQNTENNFERIEETSGQNFFLLQAKDKLLLGNSPKGIFEIDKNCALDQSYALKNAPSVAATSLANYPNYIITQVWDQGIALIEYKDDKWVFKHLIKGFNKNARYIEEDTNGDIWLNADSQLYKIRLSEKLDSVSFSQKYEGDTFHLPQSFIMPYCLNNGEIIFSTNQGIFRYLPDVDYFEPHPDFPMISRFAFPLIQDSTGNIWFELEATDNGSEKGVLHLVNGKYEILKTPFLKFTGSSMPNNKSLYPYSDSLVYFGTNKGLFEYHPKQKTNYDTPFSTLIREIFVNDSLFYGGTTADFSSISDDPVMLKYSDNDLFFHYTATFYEDSEKNMFSYRLKTSSDTTWSAWINDHKKEYTNLQEGKYIFEVKSQNIYHKYGKIASYAFEILPPWQRTWFAYTLYGILAIGSVLIIIYINSARLKRHNEQLKQTVKKRTSEILEQKEELLSKNKKLIDLDQFKEGMTGMIVHDLKNPLSTIIGLSEKGEIQQAGKQMLNMVLNLLDVQKLEDAEVKLQIEDFPAFRVINDALKQVQLLYDRKSIAVSSEIYPKTNLLADIEIVIRIIVNILTNAIKYTPNNGSITIKVVPEDVTDFVKISITDSGEGIPKDNLAFVFDKFSQVGAKKSGVVASTGLGLTFCKLAVEAHGGEIGVESEYGNGTTFWFLLPQAKSFDFIDSNSEKITISMGNSLDKQLTISDRMYLKPFVKNLKEFTVYEFSDIIAVLNEINVNKSDAIKYWKVHVENAVRSCNDKRYEELLHDEINE